MYPTAPCVAAILFGLSFGAAMAQEAPECESAPTILATADYLLTPPTEAPRFWRDVESDDAAYLKIRYAPLDTTEAHALINSLAQRQHPPQRIEELNVAQLDGPERRARVQELEKTGGFKQALVSIGPSGLRALMLDDNGEWLFQKLSHQDWYGTYFDSAISSVADVGDDILGRLADKAEQKNLWEFALGFSMMKSNLADYVSLVDRVPPEKLQIGIRSNEEQRKIRIERAVGASSMRIQPLDVSRQPAVVQALFGKQPFRTLMRPAGAVIYRIPEAYLVLALLNGTGDIRLAGKVLLSLDADLSSGNLNPAMSPDEAVASMIRKLDALWGRDVRLANTKLVSGIPGSRLDGITLLNQAVARNALSPIALGKTDSVPERPAELAPDFDWARWSRIAVKLRKAEPIAPEDKIVAAQLLEDASKPIRSLEELQSATDQKQARAIAHDLMRRLDRRCQHFLRPTQPAQESIFRFEN